MPMELLFNLAQSELPVTIDNAADIDKLRVMAAAQLITAKLPEVDTPDQTAVVLAISSEGRAALARAYPHHEFDFFVARPSQGASAPEWLASPNTHRVERDTRRPLDS